MATDDGRDDTFPWMAERRALFDLYNTGRLRRTSRRGRVALSEARAHARTFEARPEIMRAWASVSPDAKIPDEEWDLITDFNAYLWVKSGCSLDVIGGIGAAVRRVATRQIDSVESDDFAACLLEDPHIVDDRAPMR